MGGQEGRCGRPGGSVESQHLEAADGCQGAFLGAPGFSSSTNRVKDPTVLGWLQLGKFKF